MPAAKSESKSPSAAQKALEKLGLKRDIDLPLPLPLPLPLRYEDETRITRLVDAREGDTVQIEAVVAAMALASTVKVRRGKRRCCYTYKSKPKLSICKIIPRQAALTLVRLAPGFPVLAITGPRQSGKTTLARALFGAKPYVSLEKLRSSGQG